MFTANPTQTRRVYLVIVTLLALAGPISAQPESTGQPLADQEPEGTTVIEIGTTSLPPRLVPWFKKEIAAFEDNHQNIQIKTFMLSDPVRPVYGELEDLPRLAENVICIEGSFGGETAHLASGGHIVPINTFLPDKEIDFDQYYKSLWEPVTYQDKIWGVPFCMDSMWLFCDWPAFQAAGIDAPPKTWEELFSYAKRMTVDRDGDGEVDQWGLYIPPSKGLRTFLWLTLNAQSGVKYLKDGQLHFRQEESLENLAYVKRLSDSGYTYEESIRNFGFGGEDGVRCGMILINNHVQVSDYFMKTMRRCFEQQTYRVAPIPHSGEKAFFSSFKLYLAVRPSTPDKETASWKFVKWMTRKDVSLPNFWYGNPCRIDFWSRPDVREWSESFCPGFTKAFEVMAWSRRADAQFTRQGMLQGMQVMDHFFDGRLTLEEALEKFEEAAVGELISTDDGVRIDALFR